MPNGASEHGINQELASLAADIAFWEWDLLSGEIYYSPEWKKQLGYADHELENVFETWKDHLHPDDKMQALQVAEHYSSGITHTYSNEFRLRHRDGCYRWIHARAHRRLNREGAPVRIYGCHLDITAQKEEQLKNEDAQRILKELVEQAPVSIEIYDTNGTLTQANQAFENFWQIKREDVVGRYNILDSGQAEELGFLDYMKQAYAGERPDIPNMEFDASREDLAQGSGRKRCVKTLLYPIKNGAGIVTDVAMMHEDVSDVIYSKQAFEQSEERYRSLFENSQNGIIFAEKGNRNLRYANPAAAQLLGYSPEELCTLNVVDIHPEWALESVIHRFDAQFEGNSKRKTFTLPCKRRDGRIVYADITPTSISTSEGTFSVGFFNDVTQRKEAEERLAESEETFRALMEQSPLSIQLMNLEGYITRVNQAWKDLWGFPEKDLDDVLANYSVLQDQQVVELGLMPEVRRAFQGEPMIMPVIEYDAEHAMTLLGVETHAHKRWIRGRFYPVKNSTGKLRMVVYIEEDITAQHLAELDLANYRKQLRALAYELTLTEERERRRIAGELHDGAAQTLASIRFQLQNAQSMTGEQEVAALLNEVSVQLKETIQQIRSVLLDLSSPSLNEIGLAAALSEWIEDQMEIQHGIQVNFSSSCDALQLEEDIQALLFRNIREILHNVVKHAEATQVDVDIRYNHSRLLISVNDNGRGFDSTALKMYPSEEGGFGLFNIREQFADMGGTFNIESKEGEGCYIELSLPVNCRHER